MKQQYISEIAIYELYCDDINPENINNTILCYMDRDTFLSPIKTEDVNKVIAQDMKDRYYYKKMKT